MIDIANIPIGHVFPKALVIDRDAYNSRWILKAIPDGVDEKTKIAMDKANFNKADILQKPALILASKYVPPTIEVKETKIIQNLVVIGKVQNKLLVALKGYGKALRDYFYTKLSSDKTIKTILGRHIENYSYTKSNISYKPVKSNWNLLFDKWKDDCGERFKDNFKVEEIVFNVDIPFLNVFIVRCKDYVFPVFGFKYINLLLGESLFYPNIVDEDSYSAQSIYKTDNLGNFPRQFTAKIKNNSVSKEVLIFLHGFIYPAKWHFGIWKHVLALTHSSEERERLFWAKLWGTNFSVNHDLFKYCKAVKDKEGKEVICDQEKCVSLSLFKDVHPQIKDYCKLYLEQFVTSLESNTINTIAIFKSATCYNKIELVCVYQTEGIYQKIVFRGICYNWDNTTYHPVLHLVPLTMYLDKTPLSLRTDGNKSIFSGSLCEVRQCD